MAQFRAALTLALLVATPGLAQDGAPTWADAEVEIAVGHVVEKALGSPGAVGFSVSVGIDGRVALEKGYGLCELEHEVPTTARTVFRIGSITKQFTSALVMRLVEQGKVDVDELAATYLPEVDFAGRDVTVRQLLNHSSGIASYTDLGPEWQKTLALELTDEELLALFTQAPPDFAPGEGWKYNNSGYYLLGMLVEAVSGERYPQLITGMCAPLGMPRTRYGSNTDLIKDRAQGYQWTLESLQNDGLIGMSQPGAAGALLSTAGELVRWAHALAEGTIVSSESYVEMTTPTVTFDGSTHDYGFGLMMGVRNGQRWVGHGGGINGFNSMLTHYPGAGLVVCVISNSEKASAGDLAEQIAAVLLVAPPPGPVKPEQAGSGDGKRVPEQSRPLERLPR